MSDERTTQAPTNPAWFVCKYQNHWARGRTPEEARKLARKMGGRGELWAIFKLPEGAHLPFVNGIGQILWEWAEGTTEEQKKNNRCPVVKHGRKFKAPKG